ncbi:MAG: class I SAM-dependent RNA methyltransferase [Deltaproteobacteria bacterium]|nr:class I SAM-dependent RNA methyltransferase [Deltaproteobacteria bacterium]
MNDPVRLRIRTLATGGDAVGHPVDTAGDTPATWFLPDALLGELVLAEPVQRARKHVVARMTEVLEPSPARVTPPCPWAGECGGCQWQHIAAGEQSALKLGIVRDALRAFAVAPVLADVANPREGLNYRRRARLHYTRGDDGLALGFHRRRSNEVVDIPRCAVLLPPLRHAIDRLRAAAAVLPEQGEVHALCDGQYVVLGLPGVRDTKENRAALEACLDRVLVGIELRGGRARAKIGECLLEIDGSAAVPGVVASAFSFAQARADVNRVLVRHVVVRAKPHGKRVLELYAGGGNFTRALAKVATRVWTCDDDRESVSLLRKLAVEHDLPINAKHGDVAALLPRIAEGESRYEVVVADPPRAGLGQGPARALARIATERIVLVACDVSTLARDLAVLVKHGWAIADVTVFDMMPMTPEVEVVVTLLPKAAA